MAWSMMTDTLALYLRQLTAGVEEFRHVLMRRTLGWMHAGAW